MKSFRPLQRLMGLETQYAIRFTDADKLDSGVTHRRVFHSALRSLEQQLPIGPTDYSRIGKEGVFVANGIAVWFERMRYRGETGLIEGCSPECAGPRQVLTWQRATDRLLGDAVCNSKVTPDAALLKNCRDAFGQSYGGQENYEVEFADGWKLTAWKIGHYCLVPLTAAVMSIVFFMMLVLIAASMLALPVYFMKKKTRPRWLHADLKRWFFGGAWFDSSDVPYPLWTESFFVWSFRILLAPVTACISIMTSLLPYRTTQKKLLPFLISRICFAGSGWLDEYGEYHLSERASSRTREYFHFLMDYDRPIFSLATFCKDSLLFMLFKNRARSLFQSRQRLRVSVGDSNMCEEAEYLKLATTALVIDAIEAGFFPSVPTIRQPLASLRELDCDSSLKLQIPTANGPMSAIELQHFYMRGCRKYVDSLEDSSLEAQDVLVRWADILEKLETHPRQLVGRLDWVTKLYLLNRAGADAPLEERKKIDLKYAELSPEGYFQQLGDVGLTSHVVDAAAIEKATRVPPPVKGPVMRSHYIREFSANHGLKWVGWNAVQLSDEFGSSVIHFEDNPDSTALFAGHVGEIDPVE